MSYTRPAYNAVNEQFTGVAYTRPANTAVNLSFAPSSYSGTGAVTLDGPVAAGSAAHGVAGAGAVTISGLSAAGDGTFTTNTVAGDGDVTLDLVAAGSAAHGVAGAGDVAISALTCSGQGAHGVAGVGACSFSLSADGAGIVYRYEVSGQVQQSGVLVNRHVRVYRRDTGVLVGEADTVLGRFKITTGFAAIEHYIVPVNLADDATDWTPPVANRVISLLAHDA